jgi:DnaJ family protein C protein 7
VPSSQAGVTASPGAGSSTPPPPSPSPNPVENSSPKPTPEPEEDNTARAEKVKEFGNVAFKTARYADAIECYTKAIGEW